MLTVLRPLALRTLAALLALAAGPLAAEAAEVPAVAVQANGPGWITVTYSHSGTGGVSWYDIERQGGGGTRLFSPEGQWTDSHLSPDTSFSYRVCAVYEEEEEPACSRFQSAHTFPAPGKPANFGPPIIGDVGIATDSILVSWGATGDYTRILARLEGGGIKVQHDLDNVANASFTFTGLRPGTQYSIGLKGCSKTLTGSSCGAWAGVLVATAEPPRPFVRPSKPVLTIAGKAGGTVTLSFSVKAPSVNAADRFIVLIDGNPAGTIEPRGSTATTLAGSFSHDVASYEQFSYRVCYKPLNQDQVCSNNRKGPLPLLRQADPDSSVFSADKARKPDGVIVAGDIDPGMAVADLPPLKMPGDATSDMTGDPVPTVDFNGMWVGTSDKGWTYRWILQQNGSRVFGDYVVTDNGAGGTMKGTVNGNVLTFFWADNAGYYRGSGRLTLDGNAFTGTYRVTFIADGASLSADLMQGSWNAARQ